MAGPTIKAIETVWNGYKFRSRLEARWAVFLSTLGVQYEYEAEGFLVGQRGYLPDFRAPNGVENCPCSARHTSEDESEGMPYDRTVWIEIKPTVDHATCDLLAAFAKDGGREVLLLAGSPWPNEYQALQWNGHWYHRRNALWHECPVCHTVAIDPNAGVVGSDHGSERINPLYQCMHCDVVDRSWTDRPSHWQWHKGMWIMMNPHWAPTRGPRLTAAFTAARQARFEHGEAPRQGR